MLHLIPSHRPMSLLQMRRLRRRFPLSPPVATRAWSSSSLIINVGPPPSDPQCPAAAVIVTLHRGLPLIPLSSVSKEGEDPAPSPPNGSLPCCCCALSALLVAHSAITNRNLAMTQSHSNTTSTVPKQAPLVEGGRGAGAAVNAAVMPQPPLLQPSGRPSFASWAATVSRATATAAGQH